jgi:hypothetical protein
MGCEKEVKNIKIPQASPKLVINAFISPQDTLIRVSVTKSAPVLGKTQLTFEDIKDATVILSDGFSSITLEYNPPQSIREQLYRAEAKDFPIIAGKTYFLKVTNPEGLQAEASCTVPFTQNTTLEVDVDSMDSEYGVGKTYTMEMKWQDTPGEVNYYRYSAEVKSVYKPSPNQANINYYPVYFDQSLQYLSDNRLDGTIFTTSPTSFTGGYFGNINYDSLELRCYLLNTDEHYYRYHQSIRNSNVDNPFAEPGPIYSNVRGGLGVFAAYNQSVVTLQLK